MNKIIEKIFDGICNWLFKEHNSQEKVEVKKPKHYLFFDTETSGLPRDYNAPTSDVNNWPRLVQLSWILTDSDRNEIHSKDFIIKPEGFLIPEAATKLHGITTEYAKENGTPLKEVLKEFLSNINDEVLLVGHNISFDKNIVGAELIRAGRKDILAQHPAVCTMKSTVDLCQIPGKYGYKYPKLQELHEILFGLGFGGAHNSMNDVAATMRCYWELVDRGEI